jgi:multicomponent Na+:H+ antiporter subunit E
MLVRAALLLGLWLLAWGEVSVANVLTGTAIAAAILVSFPLGDRSSGHLRVSWWGIVRLGGYVVSQLVISNVLMARQILRRDPDAQPGVIAHRLGHPSEEAVTVMTSIIALSPGTMTVDVDPGSTTIYVHFFRLRDVAAARSALLRLDGLVTAAIVPAPGGSPALTSEEAP